MPLEIKKYEGKTLSKFRTFNRADFFAEIRSASDALEAFDTAKRIGRKPFVLGAGSNVFFSHTNIKSFVLKNALPRKIECLGGDRFEVSSSVSMYELLLTTYKDGRDACYYLASAPCEVGGAIAMNAGTGPKEAKYIFDFLESVKFVRNGKVLTLKAADIEHSHRHTELDRDAFVLSAVFAFPKKNFDINPVRARLEWAKEHQDLSVPNCGSLCNKYNAPLMKIARFMFRPFPAGMSRKKLNWAYNLSGNPTYLRSFLFVLRALHFVFRKELKFELKTVR